jgi:hypothetical protein
MGVIRELKTAGFLALCFTAQAFVSIGPYGKMPTARALHATLPSVGSVGLRRGPSSQRRLQRMPMLQMGLADRRIAPTGITVGIPRETQFGAVQVAATPQVVGMLIKSCGYTVVVESGAGEASGYSNDQYLAAGAQLLDTVSAWAADIVFKVNAPNLQEVELATQGSMVISYFPA